MPNSSDNFLNKRSESFEEVKRLMEEKNYKIVSTIDDYKNCNSKLKYICLKHEDKGVLEITLYHLKEGKGCRYCGYEKTAKTRKIEFTDEYVAEVIKRCIQLNFTYKDIFRDKGKITIKFICNKHQELGEQTMPYANLKRQIKGCKYCCSKNLPEWYVLQKIKEVNPDIVLLEKYVNLTTKIKCKCIKHNVIMEKTPQNILKGLGCYQCGIEKLSYISTEDLREKQKRIEVLNPHITLITYIPEGRSYFYCSKHNQYFLKSINGLYIRKSGCTTCYKEYIQKKICINTRRI